MRDSPNCFRENEYTFGESLLQALVPEGAMSAADMDWKEVRETLKKPVFSFLNNEVVKQCKMKAMQEVDAQE